MMMMMVMIIMMMMMMVMIIMMMMMAVMICDDDDDDDENDGDDDDGSDHDDDDDRDDDDDGVPRPANPANPALAHQLRREIWHIKPYSGAIVKQRKALSARVRRLKFHFFPLLRRFFRSGPNVGISEVTLTHETRNNSETMSHKRNTHARTTEIALDTDGNSTVSLWKIRATADEKGKFTYSVGTTAASSDSSQMYFSKHP